MIEATYFVRATERREEFDTVEEAAAFLAWGEDAGTLSSLRGEIRDGDTVIRGDELARLVQAAWARL